MIMSANNYILILRKDDDYLVEDRDAETDGVHTVITCTKKLEDAIHMASLYRDENDVEYGLQIRL